MAELSVLRKKISQLFNEQGRKYIIPDYQRPYKWDKEKCEILWLDLIEFYQESKGTDSEYYLGTIVTCKNEDETSSKDVEVIDGQQRIISLLLLLRAFYKNLEGAVDGNDPKIVGLKNQIGPCIWDVDPISLNVTDTALVHIESRVATDTESETLHRILKDGQTDPGKHDLYSENYRFFKVKCNEYASQNPMDWQPFCVALLGRCIILPIECDKLDSALRIFYTLNDRGMPLSDSDIFEAQIYKSKASPEEKLHFAVMEGSNRNRRERCNLSG